MKRFLFLLVFVLDFASLTFAAGPVNTITLTSYYPAPYGAYDRMRLVPREDLGLTCSTGQEGTLYTNEDDRLIYQCRFGNWVGIGDGLWRVENTPANARFDSIAQIDQYYLRDFALYNNVDVRQPYVGIGTNDPTSYLHILSGDKNPAISPTYIRLQNMSSIVNPQGPGGKIAFAGAAGDHTIIRALFENLTAGSLQSSLGIFLRDGSAAAAAIEQFHLSGNGFLGIRDTAPSAILELAGNALIGPPAAANTLPYLRISSNNVDARNGDVLTIDKDGNVGIANSGPLTFKLQVNGDIKVNSTTYSSDVHLKKDIAPVINALDKISRLKGVSFEWKDRPTDHRKHIGVIAQDVEKIFPEVVYGQEGDKSVDYASLIAPLIEAVKELKNQNQTLDQQLKAQSRQILEQQQQIESLKNAQTIRKPVLTP